MPVPGTGLRDLDAGARRQGARQPESRIRTVILLDPELGQVARDRGVEVEHTLGHQLQHHGRGEGLGVAAYPDVSVDRRLRTPAQLAQSGAAGPLALLVVHAHRHPGESGIDDLPDGLLQFRTVRAGRGERHGGELLQRLRAVMLP
jgi:hypothetical protein